MPLVRIDVVEGRSDAELGALADTVDGVLLDVFAAPPGDRYQVITEHRPGHLILEDTGLGFRTLAQRLHERHGVAPTDLVVSVTGTTREDWSFGLGRAQFLEGDL